MLIHPPLRLLLRCRHLSFLHRFFLRSGTPRFLPSKAVGSRLWVRSIRHIPSFRTTITAIWLRKSFASSWRASTRPPDQETADSIELQRSSRRLSFSLNIIWFILLFFKTPCSLYVILMCQNDRFLVLDVMDSRQCNTLILSWSEVPCIDFAFRLLVLDLCMSATILTMPPETLKLWELQVNNVALGLRTCCSPT